MDIVTLTVICVLALLVVWAFIAVAVYKVRQQSAHKAKAIVVETTSVVAETVVNEPVVESVSEVEVVKETPVKKVRKPRKPKVVVEPVKEPVKAKRGAKKRSTSKKV